MSPQSYYIALLKREVFVLHRKSFPKDLLRQGKDENKAREVCLLYIKVLTMVTVRRS